MIKASRVCKDVPISSGNLRILDDISLTIASGESVAVVGASGSGKSTLLALLAGLDTVSSGGITLDGDDIGRMDEEARAKVRADKVGFVFQSFHLLSGLTALENVMLPLELRGERNAKTQAKKYLDEVGLGERLTHYPKQLSGGEQQRVAIARAFVSRPKILFADEPTGNLDTTTGAHIIDLLFSLNQREGTTLVLVTHEERLALRCDRQVILNAGKITGIKENINNKSAEISQNSNAAEASSC